MSPSQSSRSSPLVHSHSVCRIPLSHLTRSSRTTLGYTLESGVRSPWIALSPGKQAFTLHSTLDGDYSFAFAATMIANPAACMAQANTTVFNLPTESFLLPGTAVPATQLIPTEGASAAPFLICATVPDVANAAKLLGDASAQSSSTIAFSLSSSPATSWLFLLALLGYCLLSLGAGHNLGAGKALTEEVENGQQHIPTVQSYMALRAAAVSKRAGLQQQQQQQSPPTFEKQGSWSAGFGASGGVGGVSLTRQSSGEVGFGFGSTLESSLNHHNSQFASMGGVNPRVTETSLTAAASQQIAPAPAPAPVPTSGDGRLSTIASESTLGSVPRVPPPISLRS